MTLSVFDGTTYVALYCAGAATVNECEVAAFAAITFILIDFRLSKKGSCCDTMNVPILIKEGFCPNGIT